MFKKVLITICSVIILLVAFHNWTLSSGIISAGDFTYLDKTVTSEWFHTLSFMWPSYFGFGFNSIFTSSYYGFHFIVGLLAALGYGYNISSRFVFFFPILFFSIVASIVYERKYFNNVIAIPIFLFVFLLNTVSYQLINWPNMGVGYVLIPLVVFTSMQVVEKRKLLWAFLFASLVGISLIYEVRMAFLSLLISFIYILFYFATSRKLIKYAFSTIIMFSLSMVIVLLLIFFVLLPLFLGKSSGAVGQITSQPLFGINFFNLQYSLTLFDSYWTGKTFEVFITQPIPFYFWVYPLFAFGSLLFARKNKYITFFALVALIGVFMGKGAASPIGAIYAWLYYHVPIFNFFREPIEWWAITSFSYAVLITYFITYIFRYAENKLLKKHYYHLLLKTVVLIPIVAVTCTVALPVINGTIGGEFVTRVYPEEYSRLRSNILQDLSFFRTMNIPYTQRFTLFDNVHPAVSFMSLPDELKSLNPKLLSLESIKYLVLPDDSMNDLYQYYGNKQGFERFINKSLQNMSGSQKLNNIGIISLWQIPNPSPHIMPVKDLVYVSGTNNIQDIISLPTSSVVSYFFEQSKNSINADQNTLARNNLMLSNATKIDVVASCVRCNLEKKYYDYVKFPYARILPNSILYSLIQRKENTLLDAVDVKTRLSQESFLSQKRLVEVSDMLDKNVQSVYIRETMMEDRKLLQRIANDINITNGLQNNESLLDVYDYLSLGKRTLQAKLNSVNDNDTLRQMMLETIVQIDNILGSLSKKVWVTNSNDKKLIASIPQTGEYSIYVKDDPEIDLEKSKLIVNNNEIPLIRTNEGYYKGGTSYLREGMYPVEFKSYPINLLATNSSSFSFSSNAENKEKNIPIKSLLDPSASYMLSFSYQTEQGQTPDITIMDDASTVDQVTGLPNYVLNQTIPSVDDTKWHTYTITFHPHYGVENATLLIRYLSAIEESKIKINNLSLEKIYTPTVIFTKDQNITLASPKIAFQEINPTEYIVNIHNATAPFFLAFSEGFDRGWKAYVDKKNETIDGGSIQLFDAGNIQEYQYANKADITPLIKTLGQKSLSDVNHVQINNLANGFLINKTGNYTLHIVFGPQRYFLIGLFISLFVGISVIFVILFFVFKKK